MTFDEKVDGLMDIIIVAIRGGHEALAVRGVRLMARHLKALHAINDNAITTAATRLAEEREATP